MILFDEERKWKMMFVNRKFKYAFIVFVVLVLTSIVFTYAAANTLSVSYAGDGSNTISGFAISAIKYNLNAVDPSLIDSVAFTTAPAVPANSTVAIQLVSGGTWYTCPSVLGGTSITCATAGADVLSADNLRIVIAQ
jgi:hypothetical protein